MNLADILLVVLGIYLGVGLIFALIFVTAGVGRVDPHAAQGTAGFRVVIIPGTMVFWPLLANRWLNGVTRPPTEINAHRRVVRQLRTPDRKEQTP